MENDNVDANALPMPRALMRHALELRSLHLNVGAEAVARKAYAMNPLDPVNVADLGNLLISFGKYGEARDLIKRAMHMLGSKFDKRMRHNLGLIHFYTHEFQAAERELRAAAKEEPGARWDLAALQLVQGNYGDGFAGIGVRKQNDTFFQGMAYMPEWDGDPTVETLWIRSEQGIGDILQFSRYIPWAATQCKRVIFDVNPGLYQLFVGFPGIAELRVLMPEGVPPPEADAYVYLMDLAHLHGAMTPDKIPPLPDHIAQRANELPINFGPDADQLKIGFVWAGDPRHARDVERSIGLESLLPLIIMPSIQAFSLQVGSRAQDVEKLGLPAILKDTSEQLTSWYRTANLLRNLDLLVTADTGIAHLAGTVGVPTCLLVCRTPDWRWLLERTDSPWYPSIEIFRQRVNGDWAFPVNEVRHRITQLIGKRKEQAYAVTAARAQAPRSALTVVGTDAIPTG